MQALRTLAVVIGASLLVALAAPATAQTKPARTEAAGAPIRSVLWIGNSFFYYNNSMHGHYNELANAADPGGKYRGTSVTVSGSGRTGTTSRATCSPTASASTRSCPATRSSSIRRDASSTPSS